MTSSPLVRIEHYDRIAVLVLSRQGKRNAMTPAMFQQLRELLPPPDAIDGLILTGDGPVFCGGFDLKLCHQDPAALPQLLRDLAQFIIELDSRDHPVVIAAQGAAIAGGCALLGAADVAVGDLAGQYGYPVVRLGLSPAVSFPFLRTLVSDGHARARLLDPGLIDGVEARRIGLIHKLADIPEDCGPSALRICKMLAAKPRHAFAATKQLIRNLAGAHATAAAALNASLATATTADTRNRLAAMFSK